MLDADFVELLLNATSMHESMLKGFNLVCDIQYYWRMVEEEYLEPSRRQRYQDIIEPIIKLYSHILDYQARVVCHLSKRQFSRAWEQVSGWNDWDGKSKEVERMSEHYRIAFNILKDKENQELELQKMEEMRKIRDEIRVIPQATGIEIGKLNYDQKVRDLKQDLASDYETCKDYNPPRVQGTCEWFFTDERFHKWRDSDFGLLWVSAGPGSGKSVLARALIDEKRLSAEGAISTICYFFFKGGDEHHMCATNALSAILHQLFRRPSTGDLIEHAIPSYENFGKGLVQNLSELWRILINCADSPNAGEIVCVLDGLDECHPKSREQLIGKLKEFYCGPRGSWPKLKFLVTSRPYDDLLNSFDGISRAKTYARIDSDDKAPQISNEINLVIDAKVDEIARDFGEDNRRKIANELKNLEHRTYLWLHLTFDII